MNRPTYTEAAVNCPKVAIPKWRMRRALKKSDASRPTSRPPTCTPEFHATVRARLTALPTPVPSGRRRRDAASCQRTRPTLVGTLGRRNSGRGEFHHRGAPAARRWCVREGENPRVSCQSVADRAAHGADPLAVDDAHLPPPLEAGVVEEGVDEFGHLAGRDAVQIEAVFDRDHCRQVVGKRLERWRLLVRRWGVKASPQPAEAGDEEECGHEPEHGPILRGRQRRRGPGAVCYAEGPGGELPQFERHLFVCENE